MPAVTRQLYFGTRVWQWDVRFSLQVPFCSRCHSDSGLETSNCHPGPPNKRKIRSMVPNFKNSTEPWQLTVNSKHMASSAVESPKRLTGIDGVSVATYFDQWLVAVRWCCFWTHAPGITRHSCVLPRSLEGRAVPFLQLEHKTDGKTVTLVACHLRPGQDKGVLAAGAAVRSKGFLWLPSEET